MAFGVGSASVGPGARAVRPHGENFPLHVGTAVIEIDGPRADRKGDILSQTAVGPIAVVEERSNLDRCKRAVFFRSCLDIVGQRRTVMRVEALLFAGEPDLDGPAGLARQERAEYGESSRDLDTESAAEIRGHDPHGFHGQAQNPSRTVLETIRILHRTPERAGAIFIDSNAGARLMRHRVDLRLAKDPFDHNVAFRESPAPRPRARLPPSARLLSVR